MRVFIGLCEVAGYHTRLARGFAELGIGVTFLTSEPHPFGYSASSKAPVWLQRWTHFAMGTSSSKAPEWLRECAKFFLIVGLGLTHRAFIFPYASSFNLFKAYGELPLLRFLRCRTIFVMHGSDSRPCFLERYGLEERDGKLVSGLTLLKRCRERRGQLTAIEKQGSYIIANPLSAQWHQVPAINWFLIGIPAPDAVEKPEYPERDVILHSPSEPLGKGSHEIRLAIQSLKREGADFDYIELIGVPHAEVLEALRNCSLVIDQLYSDQPMAGLATEAAACGKASIVGGYGWDDLKEAAGMIAETYPPVFECAPDEIRETIARCLSNRESVEKKGESARRFVRDLWSPTIVADRFRDLFQGKPAEEWWVDPSKSRYTLGCTARPIQIIMMIRTLLALDGEASLGLNHNPELKSQLVAMATEPQSPETEAALERVVQLERALAEREEKIENFRGMIRRREARIEKLEKKLKIRKDEDA